MNLLNGQLIATKSYPSSGVLLSVEKLDVRGKMCPLPVAYTKRKLDGMESGQLLEVVGEGDLEFDNVQRWVKNNGHEVVDASKGAGEFRVLVKKH
jgi:tRNA 2-thiouridine synthesizing protein A